MIFSSYCKISQTYKKKLKKLKTHVNNELNCYSRGNTHTCTHFPLVIWSSSNFFPGLSYPQVLFLTLEVTGSELGPREISVSFQSCFWHLPALQLWIKHFSFSARRPWSSKMWRIMHSSLELLKKVSESEPRTWNSSRCISHSRCPFQLHLGL